MLDHAPDGQAPPESALPPPTAESVPQPAAPTFVGPDRISYRVSAPEGGYFVHVANLLPGWHATVDGRETPILLANALFRAVPISPGDHMVELRYQPFSIDLGLRLTLFALTVAALSLLTSLLAVIVGARRRSLTRSRLLQRL